MSRNLLSCAALSFLLVACRQSQAHSGPELKGKIARRYEDSKEHGEPKTHPPKRAPDVIIFLLDDTGFAQLECFGGLIKTPNIDRFAKSY